MEIKIVQDYAEMSERAAELVARLLRSKPNAVLGLPTGNTPVGMYKKLVALHKQEGLDFSGVTTFNLDEYVGADPDSPTSFRSFMFEHLFAHVNLPADNIHLLDGNVNAAELECKQYEESIQKAGGIDLLILGIGVNGHIGFNEPGSEKETRTHVVKLAETTLLANASSFGSIEQVPTSGITMGIGTMLEARKIMLVADGEKKADALSEMIHGEISSTLPASFLQKHPDLTVIVDQAAAKLLDLKAL